MLSRVLPSLPTLVATCSLGVAWAILSMMETKQATAQDPLPELHDRIDASIRFVPSHLIARQSEDGLFLRRLSLDLRNTVPTGEEVREFLADPHPNKRAAWIDRFLDDPLHQERMVTWYDLTLMERRPAQNVDRQQWLTWLRRKVGESVTIDELTKEILLSEWWSKETRPHQRFFLDREGDPHLVTRDFSRIFLGRDLQCAQCHDHPQVTDFKQRDYHGLLAFFSPSALVEVNYKDAEKKDQKMKLYVEKAPIDAPFESVFVKGKQHWAGPMLLDRLPQWDTYAVPADRYQGPATPWIAGESPKKPVASRREQLANLLRDPSFRPFAENWANRLWSMLFGEGIVQPLDMHHPDNPPDNPALLQVLTDGLIEHGFATKPFLRSIALTQAYQRSMELPMESNPDQLLSLDSARLQQDRMSLERKIDALRQESKELRDRWSTAIDDLGVEEAEHVKLRTELGKLDAVIADASKKLAEASKGLENAKANLANAQKRESLLSEAIEKLETAKGLGPKEDAELSGAIATTTSKRDAAKASLAGLQTAIATALTNHEKAVDVEKQAQDAARHQAQLLEKIREPIEKKYSEVLRQREAWRDKERELHVERLKVEYLQAILDWKTSFIELAQLTDERKKAEQEKQERLEKLAMIQAQKRSRSQILESISKESQIAADALTTQKARSESLDKELATLVAARTQLQEAQKLVAKQESLQGALEEMDASIRSRQLHLDKEREQRTLTETQSKQIAARQQETQQQFEATIQEERLELEEASKIDDRIASLAKAIDDLSSKRQEQFQTVLERSANHLAAVRLRPMSAEQICWSILRVMGIFEQYVTNESNDLEKALPVAREPFLSSEEKKERVLIATQRAIDKLRGNADHFARLYAAGSGQSDSFFASVDQALYLANGGSVHSWAGSNGRNLTARLMAAKDREEAIQDLYWTLLCRPPTPQEIQALHDYWDVPADQKGTRAQEAVWAILSGVEFRFVQ